MLRSTLSRLRCPRCGAGLSLQGSSGNDVEIRSGSLRCQRSCREIYPILAGVAVLVPQVQEYLLNHVKGIARIVEDEEIPPHLRKKYLRAKAEIEVEHIEEDLEAERVVSLYLMNHYLRVKPADGSAAQTWWKPNTGPHSAEIDALINKHWDSGPFTQIVQWMKSLNEEQSKKPCSVVELGCGVGGLAVVIRPYCGSYLGVDSSFASIALARQLVLGVETIQSPLKIPSDLLFGPVSQEARFPKPIVAKDGSIDFVVGDLEGCPIALGEFDVSIALNAIDMLPEPEVLPRLQFESLRPGGTAIQSGPYIWHEAVARELRERLPRSVLDSASAVQWLYQQAGLRVDEQIQHLPWLFFKHFRQLEIYSVHIFRAKKA